MWKFKSWTGKDKWLFLLTLGVIFCILAFPVDSLMQNAGADRQAASITDRSDTTQISTTAELVDAKAAGAVTGGTAGGDNTYEAELEQRVKEILKTVDGVGKVDVMITLKSSSEKVIHVDGSSSRSLTEEKDSGGGTRKIESEERETSTVLTSKDGQNAPIIEKELRPEISGIVISAAGGGSPAVCAEISSAMEALFGLPPHKIKVLKRVE